MPSINILYLIEKDVLYISTIYLIDTREYRIQVFCLQFCKTVVIKVGIAIVDAMLQKHLMTKGRFTTSPHITTCARGLSNSNKLSSFRFTHCSG